MTLHPSTWAFPADCNAREGAGGAIRAGGRGVRVRELPGSPGLIGELEQAERGTSRTRHCAPLKVQSGPLGSVSTLRISVADVPRGQWQLHHHLEPDVLFCCALDGEPTGPGAVGGPPVPSTTSRILGNPSSQLSAWKAGQRNHTTQASRQSWEVWASCRLQCHLVGHGECDFQERTSTWPPTPFFPLPPPSAWAAPWRGRSSDAAVHSVKAPLTHKPSSRA